MGRDGSNWPQKDGERTEGQALGGMGIKDRGGIWEHGKRMDGRAAGGG